MNVLKALEEVAAWTVGQVGFFCRQASWHKNRIGPLSKIYFRLVRFRRSRALRYTAQLLLLAKRGLAQSIYGNFFRSKRRHKYRLLGIRSIYCFFSLFPSALLLLLFGPAAPLAENCSCQKTRARPGEVSRRHFDIPPAIPSTEW